jgi:hypothetical protein
LLGSERQQEARFLPDGHHSSFRSGNQSVDAQFDWNKRDSDIMTFAPPASGNPRGPYAPSRERARFSSEFISALLRDFRQGGPAAIAKVRKHQPAAYMKICALLVPREMKVEHSGAIKAMTDEQLEEAIEVLQAMLAQGAGESAKLIEGTGEPAALPAPKEQSIEAAPEAKRRGKSRPMKEVDRQRTP